jgi:DNA-binding NtrC family response regulator
MMNAVERGVVLSRSGLSRRLRNCPLLLPERGAGAAGIFFFFPRGRLSWSPARHGAAGGGGRPAAGNAAPAMEDGPDRVPTATSLEAVERLTILRTLDETHGNKSEAARRLGITRRTLHQKLRKYGVMGP